MPTAGQWWPSEPTRANLARDLRASAASLTTAAMARIADQHPWFAQLAHGYCPPEGTRFARHTPPTTFPGRDDDTDPSRVPPEPRSQGSVRGKNS